MIRYIAFILIVCITIALCLWPDLHPERMVVSEHRWYIDLITHGGYYFVATTLLLALKLKPGIYKVATAFFVLSLALEFLQYYGLDWRSNRLGNRTHLRPKARTYNKSVFWLSGRSKNMEYCAY